MTQYIIQNEDEQYLASFSKSRISWTTLPELAKTFLSREAATKTLRKVNHYYRSSDCWVARLVRD